jgi:hypothetical protein
MDVALSRPQALDLCFDDSFFTLTTEPLSAMGLGLGIQDDLAVDMSAGSRSRVVIRDLSCLLPGSPALALLYSLGTWRTSSPEPEPKRGAGRGDTKKESFGRAVVSSWAVGGRPFSVLKSSASFHNFIKRRGGLRSDAKIILPRR